MPVCHYGGAKCTAGPGAAGDAATVNAHEVEWHGKNGSFFGGKHEHLAPFAWGVKTDEALAVFGEHVKDFAFKPHRRMPPEQRAARNRRKAEMELEHQKRGY